jgi:tetratricopeptide (TPR) repeat protein
VGAGLFFLHIVCPLIFFTDVTRNPYAIQGALLQTGLLVLAAAAMARALVRGSFRFRLTPWDGPVIAWIGVALASWGASWLGHPDLRPSVFHEGFRNQIFLAVNLCLPFFLARTVPSWEGRIRGATLAVGAFAAGYGLLQYFGVEWIWDKALNPYNGRPVSTFGNPNFLSSYLVLLVPFALRGFVEARTAARGAWGGMILLYGSALISTMTRSSWIGVFVAVGAFFMLSPPRDPRKARSLLFLGAALLLVAAFWPGSPVAQGRQDPFHRMAELVQGVSGKEVYGSWHQRLLIWNCAWDMVKANPLLGAGWGCFELFFPFFQGTHLHEAVFHTFRTHANNAHNVVLEIVSQTGLAGLGVALWGACVAWIVFRRRSRSLPEDSRTLAAAEAAALAGMAADNFFGNVSLFFAVPGFLAAWTAGTLAARLSRTGEGTISFRRPGPLAAAVVFILAASAGSVWVVRSWAAEAAYFEGYKRVRREDLGGAIRFLESSRSWRRYEVNNAYELGNSYLAEGRRALGSGLSDGARGFFGNAVLAYDDALAANAGYDEIHFNKASALLLLNRLSEAEAELRESLVINPQNEQAIRMLADLYSKGVEGPWKDGTLFALAARHFPGVLEFWSGLGTARLSEGRFAEAADAWARALALNVDDKRAEAALREAVVRGGLASPSVLAAPGLAAQARDGARRGRWKEASAAAEALTRLVPDWPLGWLMAADLRVEAGDPAGALSAYDRFLAAEPSHRTARRNKAHALNLLGRTEEARALEAEVRRGESGAPPGAGGLTR